MQCGIARGNHHRALGGSVPAREGEGLGSEVGHEDDGRAVAEEFLDHGGGVGERFDHGEVERFGRIPPAGGEVFLAEPGEDVRPLREDLEEPGCCAAGGVLGGEEEGEEGFGDFLVRELPDEGGGFVRFGIAAGGYMGTVAVRRDHVQHPVVDHATRLSAGAGHGFLARLSAAGELSVDGVGSAPAAPGLGAGDVEGERDVDELESSGDQVEVVRNALDGGGGDVVAEESAAGEGTVDFAEEGHERERAVVVGRAGGDELGEVGGEDFFLGGEVSCDGFVGEERGEAAAVFSVGFALEEDPGVVAEYVFGDGYEAGLGVGGGLEDFMGDVAVGGEDDESARICASGGSSSVKLGGFRGRTCGRPRRN